MTFEMRRYERMNILQLLDILTFASSARPCSMSQTMFIADVEQFRISVLY